MVAKPDYRDLIVTHPSCSPDTQAEHLDGVTYDDFDALLRSLRPGSIVRIYRPFLLGGAAGSTRQRRKRWADRAEAIKAKDGKLVSIDPPLSGPRLTMRAAEEIGNIARGKAGRSKPGRPPKDFTDAQVALIRHHWPPRRGVTIKQAQAAINAKIKPRRVSLGWLYGNVK